MPIIRFTCNSSKIFLTFWNTGWYVILKVILFSFSWLLTFSKSTSLGIALARSISLHTILPFSHCSPFIIYIYIYMKQCKQSKSTYYFVWKKTIVVQSTSKEVMTVFRYDTISLLVFSSFLVGNWNMWST